MKRPVEKLSHRQREATPKAFAEFLLRTVKRTFRTEMVACLWVQRKSVYWQFWPQVDLWGLGRDARKYDGQGPIVAHPPCGPWGNYKAVCKQSKEDGILAMQFVHEFGGIVEQPVGSSLFREYGRSDAKIIVVQQHAFGHVSEKRTALYCYGGNFMMDEVYWDESAMDWKVCLWSEIGPGNGQDCVLRCEEPARKDAVYECNTTEETDRYDERVIIVTEIGEIVAGNEE